MQNLVVAGNISEFQELWNYIMEEFFSADIPHLENFKIDSNALFSLRWVIIGLTIGVIVASVYTVYNKRYIGDFVRTLLYHGCCDANSAKTLAELEYIGYPGIRSGIKTGGSLSRWVRCAEEDAFYDELEKQKADFDALHKDEKNPPRFKEPTFKRDCRTMHFYIPEEMQEQAEIKFDDRGANWLGVLLTAVVSIILCAFLCYVTPEILKYVDNFITVIKSI